MISWFQAFAFKFNLCRYNLGREAHAPADGEAQHRSEALRPRRRRAQDEESGAVMYVKVKKKLVYVEEKVVSCCRGEDGGRRRRRRGVGERIAGVMLVGVSERQRGGGGRERQRTWCGDSFRRQTNLEIYIFRALEANSKLRALRASSPLPRLCMSHRPRCSADDENILSSRFCRTSFWFIYLF
jgi:hypothetical protein